MHLYIKIQGILTCILKCKQNVMKLELREVAQCTKNLVHKYEGLSLDSQHHREGAVYL